MGKSCAFGAGAPFQNFITAHDGKLFDGNAEFRFISWNIPNLLIIEDNFAWNAPNDWLLPDEFELTDAFASVRQLGGTVVRSYSIPIQRADENASIPKYIRALGNYNEDAFRNFDLVLKLANQEHIRLIIPLINNWPWQGGREDLASWRGKSKDAFWTDPQLISDFEDIIRYVLTRTNTLTGVRYADDKAILCWETGNEVRGATPQWTKTIAAFIKSIDKNHLVMDGYDAGIRPEILDAPDVDIVTTHHYPSPGNAISLGDQIRADAKVVAGRKAYIIGEFGFVKTDEMRDAMSAIMDSQDSGGLLWSLRFRNRTGGFYWHSEPAGADLFKAFHWPPSPVGDPYDETGLMNSVRADAYAVRGLPVPAIPIPAAPVLLPIADAAAISWQGSVGSTSYQVERAAGSDGPWQVISSKVDEAFTQYCPRFADEQVSAGSWFYRIRAKNDSGTSEASNIVGPVNVTAATLVDTMADFSRTQSHSEGWKLVDHDCRVTKEYVHRASGIARETMLYQLPTPIESFRVFSFFPRHPSTIKFSISKDGVHFQDIAAQAENEFHGTGDYGYWLPVLYHADNVSAGTLLRIQLTGETQIGRIEISHVAPTP
jgi:mannan endo-1,4-beta-mannosidase